MNEIKNDEVTLKEIILKVKEWSIYLRSKWQIIILAAIIGATIGLIYSSSQKSIYTATLSFVLEDEKSGAGLGTALGLAGSLGLDLGTGGGSIFTGSNLTELFKSRAMVEQTLLRPINRNGKEISLAEAYIQNQGWREVWNKNKELKTIQFVPSNKRLNFTRLHDSVLGVMYQNLSKTSLTVGQKDKKVAIITIEVTSTDELFAKNFCEALVEQVSDFYVTTKSKKARLNMAVLERQTDSIRRELNAAITGVAVANDNTFGLNPALNVRRAPSVRRQVDVQANTVILTELVKQSELAKVTLRKETPLIQVIDKPILPLEKKYFSKGKALFLGGFIGIILTAIYFAIKKLYSNMLNN